jgi:hypothetical protein
MLVQADAVDNDGAALSRVSGIRASTVPSVALASSEYVFST